MPHTTIATMVSMKADVGSTLTKMPLRDLSNALPESVHSIESTPSRRAADEYLPDRVRPSFGVQELAL
jgi:hypothetical protein